MSLILDQSRGRARAGGERRSRLCRPCLEGLEPREMPSSLQIVGPAPGRGTPNRPYLNLIVQREAGAIIHRRGASAHGKAGGGAAARPPWVNEGLLLEVARSLYAPITTTGPTVIDGRTFPPGTYTAPQPTRAEIARETFWAEFQGRYYVGPPRFSNQAATIQIYSDGRNVRSNQSLNNRAQMLLFPPADPNAHPTEDDPMAGKLGGLLSLFAANSLQSGTVLYAQLTNLPDAASNDPDMLDHGMPSHFQFVIDPGGVSGGAYSTPAYTVTTAQGQSSLIQGGSGGAVAFNQGGGVVDVAYVPDRRRGGRPARTGRVVVRVQGLINTTGVTNPLYQGIN